MGTIIILSEDELSGVSGGKITFVQEMIASVEVGKIMGQCVVMGVKCYQLSERYARKKADEELKKKEGKSI